MELQITVSSTVTARRVVDALDRLGHRASTDPVLPGLVVVRVSDAGDAPTVHRIAAMLDHPAAVAA